MLICVECENVVLSNMAVTLTYNPLANEVLYLSLRIYSICGYIYMINTIQYIHNPIKQLALVVRDKEPGVELCC